MATAKQIIDKALSYVGTYDGGNNNVIFNTDFYGKAVSGGAYPWCCAFVWDIFRMCGASDIFNGGEKTAYCPTVLNWGKNNGLTVNKANGQYGDIVLFDWNGDGIADHIGLIISKNTDGSYTTVEGNTATSNYSNGGWVLKMIRYQWQIIGIIRPKYDIADTKTEEKKTVSTTERKTVIDVSEHQGVIDWNKVKNRIYGAIIRCGYGDDITSQDDKQYSRNLSECERLAIPKGVYLYSYATTETQAKSELAHILRLIKGHTFELPIFLDCEEPGTESFAPTACKIICDGLKAAGYTPGIYTSTYWWNNYLNNVTSYIRWVAQWNTECTYIGDYLIWQYGTEQIDGINSEVDANIYYGDFGKTITDDDTNNTKTDNTTSSLDILYQVYTSESGWLPVVKNLEDYAGEDGEAIKGIRVFLNGDTLAVETHQMSNGSIDKLTIYAGKHTVRYRVRVLGQSNYLDYMENKKDTGGSSDTYAGIAGKGIDRLQIVIK